MPADSIRATAQGGLQVLLADRFLEFYFFGSQTVVIIKGPYAV